MPIVRPLLLFVALALVVIFVAFHGIRAVVIVVAILLLLTLPRTRVWRWIEGQLVRLTGSRRHAYTVVLFLVIGVAAVVTIVPLLHLHG